MTLDQLKKGQSARIIKLPGGITGNQFVRVGIGLGSTINCAGNIAGGPVIIRKGRQELAVGRKLSREIFLERN